MQSTLIKITSSLVQSALLIWTAKASGPEELNLTVHFLSREHSWNELKKSYKTPIVSPPGFFFSTRVMSSFPSLYYFVSGKMYQLNVCFNKTFVLLSVYIITLEE